MYRREWRMAAIFSSTSASRTRLPRKPIRVPSSFRFRVSIPWTFRIPKASRWSLPAARERDGGRRRWPLKPRTWPTTSTLRAACWPGRPRDCRRRPAADRPMTSMNKVFADLPVTIFEAMSQLARDNNAINLGQGFPDDPGPEDIRRAAADAVMDGYNQYPSMMGIPELRQAISAHYGRWHGLDLDPMTEVMVKSGGTEALTSAILHGVEPGDEVVAFQPVYDSYLPMIRQAGGIPRLVRLEPPHWRLTEEALRGAFNHKTKAVLLNNPLNPAAVVYPREDLELLARFCQEFDTIAICDEVWEHVIFDGREHIPLIAIPGMRDRTIKVGSAGKIFSLTGWKIGFVCAAPPLLRVAAKVHQFLTFTPAPHPEAALAYGLNKPPEYFYDMRKDLARSRDRLTKGLESIGFPVLKSQGTYFLTVDLSPLGLNETDVAFCQRIVSDYKVAAIPVSAFYEQDAVTSVVRFCFAKKDATLDTALERLSEPVHRRSREA